MKLTIINHKKIKEVSHTAQGVTWFYPVLLYVAIMNPFNPKPFVKPWCHKIPAGGFHFLGLRVSWSLGEEITSKRIVNRNFN